MTRRPWRRGGAVLAVLALAACSGGESAVEPLPPPPSTGALPPTTAPPDYTGVALPAVASGRTTTTALVMGPGKANLKGTVTAPDGQPVPGAVVQVERQVSGSKVSVDVAAAADGTWTVPNVLGGRYRVRAWRAPDLTLVEPAFAFLGSTETGTLDLKLGHFFGTALHPAVAPNPPFVGQPANVVVQITSRSVDAAGVVQGVPKPGVPVDLSASAWAAPSPSVTFTDGEGRVRWELVCQAPGPQPIRLLVGEEQYTLALPACVEPPPPPTAPPPTVPGAPPTTRAGATTTTRPAATTTTRPGNRTGRP